MTDPNDPWTAQQLALDHIIVAAPSLAAGSAWLEERLGVALQPGGQHLGWGTHNRLLRLGDRTYLELIAPDPSQPESASPRPFGLDDPEARARLATQPRLVHFVMRCPDLARACASLGYDPGPIHAMTRGALRWRITLPADGRLPGGGVLPTLIQWDIELATEHPASILEDRGVALRSLAISAPAPALEALRGIERDPRITLRPDAAPGLRAELATPAGAIALD